MESKSKLMTHTINNRVKKMLSDCKINTHTHAHKWSPVRPTQRFIKTSFYDLKTRLFTKFTKMSLSIDYTYTYCCAENELKLIKLWCFFSFCLVSSGSVRVFVCTHELCCVNMMMIKISQEWVVLFLSFKKKIINALYKLGESLRSLYAWNARVPVMIKPSNAISRAYRYTTKVKIDQSFKLILFAISPFTD